MGILGSIAGGLLGIGSSVMQNSQNRQNVRETNQQNLRSSSDKDSNQLPRGVGVGQKQYYKRFPYSTYTPANYAAASPYAR